MSLSISCSQVSRFQPPSPHCWETFPEETRFSGLSWAFSLFQLTILYTEDPLVHGWPCSVGHLNTILFRLVKFPRSSFHHTLGSSNQAPHLTAQGCSPPPAAQASLDPFRTLVTGLIRSPGANEPIGVVCSFVYVCMHLCVCVCLSVWLCMCLYVSLYLFLCVCVEHMSVCDCERICVCKKRSTSRLYIVTLLI